MHEDLTHPRHLERRRPRGAALDALRVGSAATFALALPARLPFLPVRVGYLRGIQVMFQGFSRRARCAPGESTLTARVQA